MNSIAPSFGRHARARLPLPTSRLRQTRRRLVLERLETRVVLASTPIISEFLAANSTGIRDGDFETSDWIEIYNPTATTVDLANWALTDNANDLNQWQFPAVQLEPEEYLVVFASGKNRAVAGQELHTNFRLSSDGEFLGLVQPDGTIVSQYASSYPKQVSDVSYGLEFNVDNFSQFGTPARALIPTNASLGTNWQMPGFSDGSWIAGNLGVGYGIGSPGFDVRYVKATAGPNFDGNVTSLALAESVLQNPAFQSFSVDAHAPVINYMGTGGGGNYADDLAFPTQTIGDDINNFVVEATATVSIPNAGFWSFGVNSDDGFRLTLTRGGNTYTSQYPDPRGPADTIQAFNLLEAGVYQLRLVMYEAFGGASVELFAAPGNIGSFTNAFQLVGDTSAGGLPATVEYVAGNSDVIQTDIQTVMKGVNGSAYVRVPFTVEDVSEIDSLQLQMLYDDGFVAWINGVEVARRNAPASVQFNSLATASQPLEQVRVGETIFLSEAAIAALVDGDNVLAIQGLNDAVADGTFLVLPNLTGSKLLEGQPSYFATPTPGGPNIDSVLGLVERVEATIPAGFKTESFTVSLSTATPGATIRYTVDGSTPTAENGILYTAPIIVSGTTNLRAVSYLTGYVTLPSITRTYIFLDDVLGQSNDGAPPPGWPSTWNANVVDYGMDPDVRVSETDQKIKDALLALPTWSITTDLENLFDPAIGIYSNAEQDGRDWERPAAVELLNPDGSAGFQVNAGLRIRGGFSRSNDNPKHALKLFFRGEYGDSTLEYPVHGTEGVTSFDKLDLRTAQNYSWSFGGDGSNNFVAEVMARYNQRDMGQPYTRSTWIHVYLNGQYWGIYQTQERAEANYAAAYFGGEAYNYDVIKPERGEYGNIATDGNMDAYAQLWEQAIARAPDGVTPAFVDYAAYMRAQGKNPDGSENLDFPVLLDVPNLTVYMLETIRGGNLDAPISAFLGNSRANNYFAIRDRTGREGFRFMQHDAEHTMRNINENRNGPYNDPNFESGVTFFNPQWLHQQLMANDEYRMQFADAVQKAFFNDGPMSTSAMIDKVSLEANKIDLAVVAESARWGDSKTSFPLGQANFRDAINGLLNNYLPSRNNIVLNQLRNTTLVLKDGNGNYNVSVAAPLFPLVAAPQFLIDGMIQRGGEVESGSMLDFATAAGTVYYTLDGSDPRLVGGGINPNALQYTVQASTNTVVSAGTAWRYLDNGTYPNNWQGSGYSDASWAVGNAQLGYGDGDETTVVSFGNNAQNKHITTLFRKTFEINPALGTPTGAVLRLMRDDGAAVYINGVEAARTNLPSGALTNQTLALVAIGGADESTFYDFAIDPSLLQAGTNVIAVEIHQSAVNSSDISFDAELVVDQQIPSGVPLFVSSQVRARALDNSGTWSALDEAEFLVDMQPASAANLRVTELHYNPAGAGSTEFVELRNISEDTIDLTNVRFTEGITYDFSSASKTWLSPHEILVISENIAEFTAQYGAIPQLVGQYSGALSNGGERLTIVAANNSVIQSFTYDDQGNGWHGTTDGGGPSLTVIRTSGNYNLPTNWRPSFVNGGTPGIEENDPPTNIQLSNLSVMENLPGALVGLLSATDVDISESFTYALVEFGDYQQFAISGNELRVGPAGLDYEAGAQRALAIRVTDAAGASFVQSFVVQVLNQGPAVLTRGVAYAGATASYGGIALATDVQALLPGQAASQANYTNYWKGLNRIVVDIAEVSAKAVSEMQFIFRVGNNNQPGTWRAAPQPMSIDILPQQGVSGSHRVVVTWSDQNAIRGEWLQTTIVASSTVPIPSNDVFYFGNQVGDVNGAPVGQLLQVDAIDQALISANLNAGPVGIANDYDLNRDGRVDATDVRIASKGLRGNGQLLMIDLRDTRRIQSGDGGLLQPSEKRERSQKDRQGRQLVSSDAATTSKRLEAQTGVAADSVAAIRPASTLLTKQTIVKESQERSASLKSSLIDAVFASDLDYP